MGIGLAGTLGEIVSGALASRSPARPAPPRWRTRPDLRIPALTITRSEPGVSTDPILIAPYNAPGGQAGAVIVGNDGQPIWENPLAGKVTTNFRVQAYRGSPVLTWWEGSIELGHGVGEYVIADSGYRTVRRVQAGRGRHGDLHEFLISPQDTALLTTYIVTSADLSAVGGSRTGSIQDAVFQEVDLGTGRVLLEWHSLEHVALEESYVPLSSDWDFFHINSVDVDNDGNLLISSRSMQTIYKIDRHTGAIIWRLGGKRSDFAMAPGSAFAWQHDARRQPDGMLTVFDNGATPAVESRSRALILEVDERAMTASLLREYIHPRILAGSQGSVQLLANGNVFVGWGEAPQISEFQRSGRMLFDAVLGEQYQSYRAFRLPWTGRPADAPAIAVTGAGRHLTAYASWNGATEVASWQLLAGGRLGGLVPVSSSRAEGFESALQTDSRGPCFAVEALDRSGGPLGRSRILTVAS